MIKEEIKQVQFLIAETKNELLVLFREYLSSRGLNTDTADRGDNALERFFDRKDKDRSYETIALDTHLQCPSGLEVAKRIRSEKA